MSSILGGISRGGNVGVPYVDTFALALVALVAKVGRKITARNSSFFDTSYFGICALHEAKFLNYTLDLYLLVTRYHKYITLSSLSL
jgi:hypothetical protein